MLQSFLALQLAAATSGAGGLRRSRRYVDLPEEYDCETVRVEVMSVEKDELRDRIRVREHEMLVEAKNDILGCGDFLPVNRLAQHFNIRTETLTPALVEWEVDSRIFSIEHESCSLFPIYAFSTQSGFRPHPELKEILAILAPTKDSWSIAFWFFSPNGVLVGKRPRDLISTDAIRVISAAQDEADGILHG